MSRLPLIAIVLLMSTALLACGSPDAHRDLRDFIEENKRRPPGTIREAPQIAPYEAFSYDAYRLRSPFELPVSIQIEKQILSSSNVQPDLIRPKERLEQFDLSALSMVGTLEKGPMLWALISDPEGGIERVRVGNYIGKNHGRIIQLTRSQIDLIEIVASGDGWLERPNVVEIKTAGQE
ncbi:MAG: pilus assembly protein PilP [Cellvibrionaceae bacterium]|nr:pilus assembly protein PilP [Cellvibrionaceae bacterium]